MSDTSTTTADSDPRPIEPGTAPATDAGNDTGNDSGNVDNDAPITTATPQSPVQTESSDGEASASTEQRYHDA